LQKQTHKLAKHEYKKKCVGSKSRTVDFDHTQLLLGPREEVATTGTQLLLGPREEVETTGGRGEGRIAGGYCACSAAEAAE
jgi:hypothetical protein